MFRRHSHRRRLDAARLAGSVAFCLYSAPAAWDFTEPIHGSAPDIAGAKASPTPWRQFLRRRCCCGTRSAWKKEAATIEAAVNTVLDQGHRTKDIAAGGPSIGTEEMGTRVVERLQKPELPACIPKAESHDQGIGKAPNVVKASHVLGGFA